MYSLNRFLLIWLSNATKEIEDRLQVAANLGAYHACAKSDFATVVCAKRSIEVAGSRDAQAHLEPDLMSKMSDKNRSSENRPVTVLAIASAGGHWQQLMQIVDAFSEANLVLASTNPELGKLYGFDDVVKLDDCNSDNIPKVIAGLWQTLKLVWRVKPKVIVSTGAAPGLLCLLWGRLFGARTIWIDSIANSQKLSLSGRLAVKFCDVVLTQWKHLESEGRTRYHGAVL